MRRSAHRRLLALILTAGMLAAACGVSGGGQKTLGVVLVTNGWSNAIKPLLPQFEKKYGIKLDVQVLDHAQATQKLVVQFHSRSPEADVVQELPSNEGFDWIRSGYFAPLDSYVTGSGSKAYNVSDFQSGAIGLSKLDGKLLGVPVDMQGPVLYYRKDLLQRYGIKVPRTLDQLRNAARMIKAKSHGKYFTSTRGEAVDLVFLYSTFLHNMGLKWTDAAGKPNFTNPVAAKAIDLYASLARDYGPPGIVNNTYIQNAALMAQGKAAMTLESTSSLSAITDSQLADKIGIANMPAGPAGSHPSVLSWNLSISKFSDNKSAAWKFIQWATSPQMQLKLALQGVGSPRESVYTTSAYKAKVREDFRQAMLSFAKNGDSQVGPPAKDQTRSREIVGQAIDEVILGKATPDQAAQQIQKGLGPLLSQGG